MRKLKRYLTCYKPTELGTKEKYKGKMRMNSCNLSEKKTSCGDDGKSSKKNHDYYSEMNEEERNEKLTSAISYYKVSEHQSRWCVNVEKNILALFGWNF
ncbi:hypothetical protein HYC85_016800 [Camellia sinensis]|uniref:Uncharacterized protein n=1 Tax=Camellia sinensis TaxID=4442 RepID=A0A7J7H0N2_CAMSI|nr:hypothetical protein HYC85_016800 [Camellia sinensis]